MTSQRKSNKDFKRKDEYGEISYGYKGKPEGDEKPEIGISIKSLKGLPKSSYSVQADPYTAALPGSEPYPMLNPFNKTVGGVYGGLKNIDGGNVQQYSSSLRSKMLHAFDFMRLPLGINYHYIPMKTEGETYPGKGLIDEQRRAVDEATSTLKSTTFTQMAIYDYAVVTDMPMGSAAKSKIKYINDQGVPTEGLEAYTNLSDVIFASTRYYQVFWLKVLGVIDWHNSFRLKMGTMIRSSWNRETSRLNGFFGLMKKKSFLSLMNSMCLALPGEYIDRNFALQFAKTCLVPSRRANALTEPVLETQVEYNMPTEFKLYAKVTDTEYALVFDAQKDLVKTVPGLDPNQSFDTAVHNIMTLLSAEDTMKWARATEVAGDTSNSDNKRFNQIKANIDVIQACVTSFKKLFTDVREVLDTCARTGIVTWFKGFRPSVTKDDDCALFRNLIVDDIYRLALGGANKIKLDQATKRFRTWTMWNMYSGIAEFDMWSGGSFLSFSLKKLEDSDDPDLITNYVPQCLTYLSGATEPEVYCVNRVGTEYKLGTKEIQLSKFVGTRRLVPLSTQDEETARIVNLVPEGEPTDDQASDYSFLTRTLVQVTGMCHVDLQTPVIYQDPDCLAIYQIEIEDITNEMVAYARKTGPFLGAINAGTPIGFLGTISGHHTPTTVEEK